MEHTLTEQDLREMTRNPYLRVLQVPFDEVYREGDHFVFRIQNKKFCEIHVNNFTERQVTYFQSFHDQLSKKKGIN